MASIFSPLGRISSNKSQMVNCCHSGPRLASYGVLDGHDGPWAGAGSSDRSCTCRSLQQACSRGTPLAHTDP